MVAQPVREVIKTLVIEVIARVSGFETTDITEDQSLDVDLGLNEVMRGALGPGFTDIARRYHAHVAVTASACERLETVKEAIDLVFNKAGNP
jgi:hypothetical protein